MNALELVSSLQATTLKLVVRDFEKKFPGASEEAWKLVELSDVDSYPAKMRLYVRNYRFTQKMMELLIK